MSVREIVCEMGKGADARTPAHAPRMPAHARDEGLVHAANAWIKHSRYLLQIAGEVKPLSLEAEERRAIGQKSLLLVSQVLRGMSGCESL